MFNFPTEEEINEFYAERKNSTLVKSENEKVLRELAIMYKQSPFTLDVFKKMVLNNLNILTTVYKDIVG